MAITRTTLRDLPDRIEWGETDPSIGYVGFGVDWKPGTPHANRIDLESKARAALGANATFLAIAAPTNAQIVAQVQYLTRECSGLIRLLVGQLDDTTGT